MNIKKRLQFIKKLVLGINTNYLCMISLFLLMLIPFLEFNHNFEIEHTIFLFAFYFLSAMVLIAALKAFFNEK